MATVKDCGSGRKWFQENIGRGGAIPLKPKSVAAPQSSPEPSKEQQGPTWEEELQEFGSQLAQEVREQMGAEPVPKKEEENLQ